MNNLKYLFNMICFMAVEVFKQVLESFREGWKKFNG